MEGVASQNEPVRQRDSEPAGRLRAALLLRPGRPAASLRGPARCSGPAQRRASQLAGQLRRRWQRSLQLRVVATTVVICVVVATVLGFFLVQQIAAGLLHSARTSAATQLSEGLSVAKDDAGLEGSVTSRVKSLDLAGPHPAVAERRRAPPSTW